MELDKIKLDNKLVFPADKHSSSIARYVKEVLNPRVRCKFCGRLLKTQESKKNGYGKSCYNRWIKSKNIKRNLI